MFLHDVKVFEMLFVLDCYCAVSVSVVVDMKWMMQAPGVHCLIQTKMGIFRLCIFVLDLEQELMV